jgi:hypothetical protein
LALRAAGRGLGLHVWSQSSSLIGISTGCYAILNRGFTAENCSSNGQAKPDRLLG